MSAQTHDCRVRAREGAFTASCVCGWRSEPQPDSSTAWSFAQDHVVSRVGATSEDFAAAFAERREAEINASLMRREEWEPTPDLLAAQDRVREAERGPNRFYREPASAESVTLSLTDETREGSVWFFHHDWHTAHNGVDVTIPFRVYRSSLAAS